jgi:phosphonate transport system substrate-binding protein
MRSREIRNWNRASRWITLLLWLVATIGIPVARAGEGELVMGVFPRFHAGETTTRYAPLADHLSDRLGRKVSLVTSRDFESFWRGIEEQRYDIVMYNQYHYIRSAKNYRVIAHNKEFGKSTLAGVLYVRKDSNIKDLTQLRGRTVLFGGGEDAMIGYIAPVYMLLQAGVKKDEFRSRFAVNPLNSVIGVYHRQADAAGSGDGVVEQPAVKNAIRTEELTVLAISEQLLHLVGSEAQHARQIARLNSVRAGGSRERRGRQEGIEGRGADGHGKGRGQGLRAAPQDGESGARQMNTAS